MLRRLVPILALAAIILSMIACEGGTSGSVVGSTQSCEWGSTTGTCEGTFKKLSGTYSVEIENDRISTGDRIDVDVDVFIGAGTVNVSVVSPEGNISSVQVLPNRPAKLTGQAEGEFGLFEITFEAVDGDVETLLWSLSYEVR